MSHYISNFAFIKLHSQRDAEYQNIALLCVAAFMLAERTLPSRHKPVIWSPFVRDLSHSIVVNDISRIATRRAYRKIRNEIRPYCRGASKCTTAREFIVPVQLADIGIE